MDDSYIKAVENCRLKLPKNKLVPEKSTNLEKFINHKNKILFAAKGPSLNAIHKFSSFVNYATVNEACCKIKTAIRFAFFFDKNALMNSAEAWDRIEHFVMPSYLFDDGLDAPPVAVASIVNLPQEKIIFFEKDQDEFETNAIIKKINNDELLTIDTAIMGLHFLTLYGFKEIFLLGHDGGFGYADDVPCLSRERNMQGFRERIEFCSKELTKKHEATIKFYGEK